MFSFRLLRQLTIAVLIALALALPSSGVVQAHAELLEVVPGDGTTVPAAPTGVTLRFSEDVALSGDSTRVLDDTGDVVADQAIVTGDTITVPLPPGLADGTYTVSWAIISADSHRLSGASVFHVGAPSAAGPVAIGDGDDGVPWSLRAGTTALTAFAYASALIAVGVAWFAALVARVRDGEVESWRDVVRKAAAIGCLALAVALPGRIATLGGGLDALGDGTFVVETLGGPIGISTAVVIVGLIGLAASTARPQRVRGELVAGLGLIALGGFVVEGHTRTMEPRLLMAGFDMLHLAAGAVWLGGIVGLVLAFRSGVETARLTDFVRRFSATALGVVAVVAAAGIGMSLIVLPSLADLWETSYGLALLTKVALVAAVVVIGAYNRRRLVPAVAGDVGDAGDAGDGAAPGEARARLGRLVRVELGVLVAVVAVTAVLVGRSPSESEAASPVAPPAETVAPLSGQSGSASFSVLPTRTGYFETSLQLTDDAGQPLDPAAVPAVELREEALALGPLELDVHEVAPGTYHVFGEVPVPGQWQLDLSVRVTDFDLAEATLPAPVE